MTPAVRDDIIDVAKTMVKLEHGFVELAFGMGDIEGMKPEEIHAYVQYVADWRLMQLKLPTVFGYFKTTESGYEQVKQHPLPWSALTYDEIKGGYVVNLDKQRLENAPTLDPDDDFEWTPDYGRRVDKYYGAPTYW